MKNGWIRELFSFSRKERTGIIVLLLIIFGLIIAGKLIPLFIPSGKTDYSKWQAEVDTYLSARQTDIPENKVLHPFVFNPNEADSVSLSKIGLPPKIITSWTRYLEKGGRFRNREGVKKIYGMTTDLWNQLDSFMVIPRENQMQERSAFYASEIKTRAGFKSDSLYRQSDATKEKIMIPVQELNSSDSVQLLGIPGIGPVFASRIVRYRNLLGGYYAVEQLREIYGMREEHFLAVSKYFVADESKVKTFNINFSTIQELGRHPYIGYRTARRITALRDKTGKFLSPDNLSPVIATDSLKKLIPYLKFTQ